MKVIELVKAYNGVLLGKPDYWHPRFKVNEHLDKNVLGKYYLDMSSKADYPGKFDANGVPLLILNNKSYHLPVTIAQFGLGNYDKYQTTKEDKYLKSVFDTANWFVNNCSIIYSSCAWYNYYENRLYSIKAPWVSAISQGQGISVLVRTFLLSQKQQYLDIALKAAKIFEIPVGKGGVKTMVQGKYVFYEEYPTHAPSLVLNGFIFGLWGLYDLYLVTREKAVLHSYEEGLKTLIHILPYYNFLGWSRYDLYNSHIPNVTNIFYHRLHIEQLKAMNKLIEKRIFLKYLTIWGKSESNLSVIILSQAVKILQKLSVRKLCAKVRYE